MPDKKTEKRPLRNMIIFLTVAAAIAVAILAYTARSPGHLNSPAERDAEKVSRQ
ncbi:hypothetical protein HL653_16730 [Sphingomonas sp. AP4-R1]|jgi:hypothetical protein|uniref:hypothetical protein n=1 Tax=Sphingomonas sp. AP4-R1 TaxID=2735134 RepID=UPI00149331BF|nr:hypothetical protein [Sphingomonas sp. AP4-R1]QJU59188.1 hypothetical protein HL653_16730 [Sphingomonas sp. AP4-R1]